MKNAHMGEGSGRGSGRVGSDFLSAIAGRVGSTFRRVGSGRVQKKWPVDNSGAMQMSVLSKWVATKTGVRQRCILAPDAFKLYYFHEFIYICYI
jgi:hypothetical protein